MVPPSSDKITRVPSYLICDRWCVVYGAVTLYRSTSQKIPLHHLSSADTRSLAATKAISIDFFSWGYLDVSVPLVCSAWLCIHHTVTLRPGFPIRTSQVITGFVTSPALFADLHVLHRLWLPRHPPYTLSHLIIQPLYHSYVAILAIRRRLVDIVTRL